MLAIGKAIRSLRINKGLSQKDLAQSAEITASFLSQVENGQKSASLTVIRRISEAMQVAPEVLMWEAVELPEGLSVADRRTCEIAKLIVRQVYTNASRAADN